MTATERDVESIFVGALERRTARERQAYVDGACAGAAEVRKRVMELLDAHDASHGPLDRLPSALADPTADRPRAEQAGAQIGPYKLLQQIGEGGMGLVYMAEQTEPVKRRVALKIMKPGMDSRQVIARFEAERQALAIMDHPNIARVLDAGTTEAGHPYFVMELVRGISITQYCDDHHLDVPDRLRLFVTVCKAIEHAHQKGIIHRDIKPTNVLVAEYDDHPVPKVIDFGVARAIDQSLTDKTLFTQFGQLVGTIEYMSPEQAKLNQLDVDTRTDVYSLGVLLYELITSQTPFDCKRLRNAAYDELLRIIREEEPPRPSIRLSARGALPTIASNRQTEPRKLSLFVRGELDWIAMKALEKERTRRYHSPLNLAADVERFLAGHAVEAHPPSASYRTRKFMRRYRVAVAVVGVLLTTLIAGTVGTATGWRQAIEANGALRQIHADLEQEIAAKAAAQRRAEAEARRADIARLAATTEAERQRQLAYVADMELAEQAWERGNRGQLYDLLRRHVPRAGQNDLRGFEWYHLWRLWKDAPDADVIPTIESGFWCWQGLSSDGSRMVIGHPYGDNAVRVLDMASRQVLASFGMGTNRWEGVGVAISADGSTVAYRSRWRESTDGTAGGTVIIRDLNTNDERHIATDTDSAVMAFSHGGQWLAIGLADGTINVLDVHSLQSVGTMAGHQDQVQSLAFSPDDSHLASVARDGAVRVWDVHEGTSIWVEGGSSGSLFSVAYSNSGKLLATGGTDKLVVVWEASTGNRLQTLVGASDEVRVVAFSPDDELLAAGCREGAIRLWRLPDCTSHRSIGGHMGLYGLNFLADGNLVSCGEDGHMVVHPVSRSIQKTLATGTPVGPVRHVAFSPDSQTLCALKDVQADKLFLWQVVEDGAIPQGDLHLNVKAAALVVSSRGCLAVGDADAAVVQLYQLSTRQPLARLEKREYPGATCLSFSPSGQRLAVGCDDGHVVVWDIATAGIVMDRQVQDCPFREIIFCGDETTLMIGGVTRIPVLWDVHRGQQIHVFPEHAASVQSLAVTRDGRMMASGAFSNDATIRLYDRETLEICGRLQGHSETVRGIRFLNGGRTLASAAGDRTIRLWDVPTRQQRFVIDLDTSIFECLEVSPDERAIAAGGRDGTVRLYRSASVADVQAVPGWWQASADE